jgi:hypothetical protein
MTRPLLGLAGAAAVGVILSVSGCDSAPQVTYLQDAGQHSSWEELFARTARRFDLAGIDPPIINIGQAVPGENGRVIVPDGRRQRVVVFGPDGNVIRTLPDEASRFPVSRLSLLALNPSGQLVVYDADGHWVTKLRRDTFEVEERIQISAPAAGLVALSDGSLITYFPTEGPMFRRFDESGAVERESYDHGDEALRILHGRVQTGGVVRGQDGLLLAVHPLDFEVVRMSEDLAVIDILRPASESRWTPSPPPFPADLNPYFFETAHEAWWDSFMHIGRPHAVTPEVLLVTLFESSGLSVARGYANMYATEGKTLAEGLRIPDGAQVIGAGRGYVYAVKNARLDSDGAISSPELLEFVLRR